MNQTNNKKENTSTNIKLTPEEQQEANKFGSNPAFQLTPRHALYSAHQILALESKNERREIIEKFARDEHFLFDFSHDYFFYRRIRKTEMKTDWYWTQIREIGYLVLLDLLHPEKATPTESWKKPEHSAPTVDGQDGEWLGERQLRRIRVDYPEVFFTPQDCHQNKKDLRQNRYMTLFSDLPLQNDKAWSTAVQMMAAQDLARAETLTIDVVMKLRQVVSGLRMVDPEDYIGLQEFRKMQKKSLDILADKYGQSTHNKWLPFALRERTNVLENMYQFIDKAVALQWFRKELKSDLTRERLMKEKAQWIFTDEEAKKGVELTFNWFPNPATAMDLVGRAVDSYNHLGMFNTAITLSTECLKQPSLNSKQRAYCYYKIAVSYWNMKELYKSLDFLVKSLGAYGDAGSKTDAAVIWSYIAEAHHALNSNQSYEEAKNQSMKVANLYGVQDDSLSEAFLDIADSAERTMDKEWEKQALKLSLDIVLKLDDLLKTDYITQRLCDLMAGKNTYLAEQEPNKLKRPSKSKWRVSLIDFAPITPESSSD